MSKYFTNDGYFTTESLFTNEQPFNFCVSARGIGKSYSATKWVADNCDYENQFLYIRRTKTELDKVNAGNPYIKHSPDVELEPQKDGALVIRNDDVIGRHLALSEVKDVRGIEMPEIKYIIFDEFIPEKGTPRRKALGITFLNAYETINRNRELEGEPAIKCVFLANKNDTKSDILDVFGLGHCITKYQDADPIGFYTDKYKRFLMINSSPVTEKKRTTALYEATVNDEFKDMALDNKSQQETIEIRDYPRKAYIYRYTLGEANINTLENGQFYLTEAKNPTTPSLKELRRNVRVYRCAVNGLAYASSEYVAQRFLQLFND